MHKEVFLPLHSFNSCLNLVWSVSNPNDTHFAKLCSASALSLFKMMKVKFIVMWMGSNQTKQKKKKESVGVKCMSF